MRLRHLTFALLLASQPFIGNMAQATTTPATPAAQAVAASDSTAININTATAEQLTQLKGIGKKKAEAIIAWRTEHGPFSDVRQLIEVSGISERFVETHQARLTVK